MGSPRAGCVSWASHQSLSPTLISAKWRMMLTFSVAVRIFKAGECKGLGCSKTLSKCSFLLCLTPSLLPTPPPSPCHRHLLCARQCPCRDMRCVIALKEITTWAVVFKNIFYHNPQYEDTLHITIQFIHKQTETKFPNSVCSWSQPTVWFHDIIRLLILFPVYEVIYIE